MLDCFGIASVGSRTPPPSAFHRHSADPLLSYRVAAFESAWRELLGDEEASGGDANWKKMRYALGLTQSAFDSLADHQKSALHAKLVATMNQSIPPTPRLAGMALQDRRKAKAQLEAFGLALDALADKSHVGGFAIISGEKYAVER